MKRKSIVTLFVVGLITLVTSSGQIFAQFKPGDKFVKDTPPLIQNGTRPTVNTDNDDADEDSKMIHDLILTTFPYLNAAKWVGQNVQAGGQCDPSVDTGYIKQTDRNCQTYENPAGSGTCYNYCCDFECTYHCSETGSWSRNCQGSGTACTNERTSCPGSGNGALEMQTTGSSGF